LQRIFKAEIKYQSLFNLILERILNFYENKRNNLFFLKVCNFSFFHQNISIKPKNLNLDLKSSKIRNKIEYNVIFSDLVAQKLIDLSAKREDNK